MLGVVARTWIHQLHCLQDVSGVCLAFSLWKIQYGELGVQILLVISCLMSSSVLGISIELVHDALIRYIYELVKFDIYDEDYKGMPDVLGVSIVEAYVARNLVFIGCIVFLICSCFLILRSPAMAR